MRIRLIQKNITNKDYQSFLHKAASDAVDLVCLGELSTSGCLYNGGPGTELADLLDTLSGFACASMLGFPLQFEGNLYNSYIFYDRGEYQIYRKINLFPLMNEDKVYLPGSTPGLFDTRFGRLGVAICYDIRFPELFRCLKENGVEMIFVPAAFPRVRINDWRSLLIQHAQSTGLPVLGINAVGDDGTNEFGGSTMVIGPDGDVLLQADETNEQFIEVDL